MKIRGAFAILVAAAPMLVAVDVRAEGGGFEAGLRTGFGWPFGRATDPATRDMNDLTSGIVPLWIDFGARMSPHVMLGAYFQHGFGIIGDDLDAACDVNEVDCSTSSTRLGAQFHYHLTPKHRADLWLGYGFGWEWWHVGAEDPTGGVDFVLSGFEFANFQLGVDLRPSPHFYIGPFASFSLDQFVSADVKCSGSASTSCPFGDGDIEDKSLHEWLVIGVRGGFTGYSP